MLMIHIKEMLKQFSDGFKVHLSIIRQFMA